MARQLRIEYAGAIYHVTVRSNGRERLFISDFDRKYLLSRIGEAVERFRVRVYLYCLMGNHFHLVVETPQGNLGRFMQSVLTGYGVHFNRMHGRHGHITQGRYGARLVEGDEYLLKLSRYVHLNPVQTVTIASASLEERKGVLRAYKWSSYLSYIGRSPRNKFVNYEPMLGLMGGRKADKPERYRAYVENALAMEDEPFLADMARSSRSIGGEKFREWVDSCYRELIDRHEVAEDASFRRLSVKLPVDVILDAVAKAAQVDREALLHRCRDGRWRAVASRMLCTHGGLTQRAVASLLGVKTGVAVCCQLKKLKGLMEADKGFEETVRTLDRYLARQPKRRAG